MAKYRTCVVVVDRDWLPLWKGNLQQFKVLASSKGLTIGKALIPLMASVESLESQMCINSWEAHKGDPVGVIQIPKGKEAEWDEAYMKLKLFAMQRKLTICSVLVALMSYALVHPDLITPL